MFWDSSSSKRIPCIRWAFGQYWPKKFTASVAANTHRLQQLAAHHAHPIQQPQMTFGNLELMPSTRSFTFLMCRIWNDLPLEPKNVKSLSHFTTFLDSVDWKRSKVLHFLFSSLSNFFVYPKPQQAQLPSG